MGSLIALGASGGLVPCPSALILLLAAIRLQRVALGLVLLLGFSLGLAAVLTGIGLAVLYAKNLLPENENRHKHPAFRLIPVFSAGVILCIGLLMTGASLGVISVRV
jgi:nickel/cobalt exporter